MQIPVTSIKTRGGRSTWLCGISFLTATAVPPFKPRTHCFPGHCDCGQVWSSPVLRQ